MLLAFMGSCATVPELKVKYQLPASSERMKGWKVCLSIEDNRSSGDFLGCAKNLVDSENMLGLIKERGIDLAPVLTCRNLIVFNYLHVVGPVCM